MIRLVCILTVAAAGCVTLPQNEVHRTAEDTPATRGQVKWLVAHINDTPTDILHGEYTLATEELIRIGDAAILPTLDLMLSGDDTTRSRAKHVLWSVVVKDKWVCGKGWVNEESEKACRQLWADLGGLDANASAEQRAASVKLWKEHFAYLAKP